TASRAPWKAAHKPPPEALATHNSCRIQVPPKRGRGTFRAGSARRRLPAALTSIDQRAARPSRRNTRTSAAPAACSLSAGFEPRAEQGASDDQDNRARAWRLAELEGLGELEAPL